MKIACRARSACAATSGFLSRPSFFATDQFFADGVLEFGRVRRALCLLLGDEGVGDALRNGNAVDRRHSPTCRRFLGNRRQRDEGAEQQRAGQF
jgi:hypothetical protein